MPVTFSEQGRDRTLRMQRAVRRFKKLEDLDYVTDRFESTVEEATQALVRLRGGHARSFQPDCLQILVGEKARYLTERADIVEALTEGFRETATNDGIPQLRFENVSNVTTTLRHVSRDQQFAIACYTRILNRFLIRLREGAAVDALPHLCEDEDSTSEK